jgi:hypothetical protein
MDYAAYTRLTASVVPPAVQPEQTEASQSGFVFVPESVNTQAQGDSGMQVDASVASSPFTADNSGSPTAACFSRRGSIWSTDSTYFPDDLSMGMKKQRQRKSSRDMTMDELRDRNERRYKRPLVTITTHPDLRMCHRPD